MSNFLTQEQIKDKVPSIFTKNGSKETSNKYAHISTYDILKGLFELGFGVTHATETKVRTVEKIGYNRHLLRLRRENEKEINGLYPELVLINSHDRSSSYQLRAGVYRMICSNGMVVGNEMLCHRIRHQGNVKDKVIEACNDIIEVFPVAIETAEKWSKIELSPHEQLSYANAAKKLKWDENSKIEVSNEQILRIRRNDDSKNDLWTIFNVVQENFIKGRITTRNKETGQRRKSKAITSPSENTRLNTALWTLTEHMASLAR